MRSPQSVYIALLLCFTAYVCSRAVPSYDRQWTGTSLDTPGITALAPDAQLADHELQRRGKFGGGIPGGGVSLGPSSPGSNQGPNRNNEDPSGDSSSEDGGVPIGNDPDRDSDDGAGEGEDDSNTGVVSLQGTDLFDSTADYDPLKDNVEDPSPQKNLIYHGITPEDRAKSIARGEMRVSAFDRGEGRPDEDFKMLTDGQYASLGLQRTRKQNGGFNTLATDTKIWGSDDIPLSTKVDAEEGTLTIEHMFLQRVLANIPPADRIRASDMMYTDWMGSTTGQQSRNLKLVHRDNVVQETIGTKTPEGEAFSLNPRSAMNEIWRHAWKTTNTFPSRVNDITLRSPSGSGAKDVSPKEAKLFHLLAAQTHLDRVYRLLGDHPNTFGDITIKSVTLQNMNAPDESRGDPMAPHLFINIGPRPKD